MADNSQGSGSGDGGAQGAGGNPSENPQGGGQQPTGQQQPNAQQGGEGSAQFDPTGLTQEQINQILEKNPHIWKADRIASLRDKAGKYDKAEQDRQAAEEKQLQEQGKYKELSDKQTATIAELTQKLENQSVNQALILKLAPLGVVNLDDALKLVDRGNIKVGEDGTVSGVDEAVEALKSDKTYLFNNNGGSQPPKVGTPTNPQDPNAGNQPTFKRSQLSDAKFYAANRDAILQASKDGRIEDDITGNT